MHLDVLTCASLLMQQVQEVLDEMGHPSIPLSVISKAAEIQLLDVVDKVLLGNKWLRKATGIQPKFPYLVDSFEERYLPPFYCLMIYVESVLLPSLRNMGILFLSATLQEKW